MPQIIPTTVTEDPDFQTIVNYNLHFNKKYQHLGEVFVRELLEENAHLNGQELKKKIQTDIYTFFMSAEKFMKQQLGE